MTWFPCFKQQWVPLLLQGITVMVLCQVLGRWPKGLMQIHSCNALNHPTIKSQSPQMTCDCYSYVSFTWNSLYYVWCNERCCKTLCCHVVVTAVLTFKKIMIALKITIMYSYSNPVIQYNAFRFANNPVVPLRLGWNHDIPRISTNQRHFLLL